MLLFLAAISECWSIIKLVLDVLYHDQGRRLISKTERARIQMIRSTYPEPDYQGQSQPFEKKGQFQWQFHEHSYLDRELR